MTNKDGFIRHRGGKCPVDRGAYISARFRSGEQYHGPAYGLVWAHSGIPADVMAYRIHTPSEQPATVKESLSVDPVAPSECTNEDSWNCKYCRKTETCEALKDPRNFGEPQSKPINGPLQWRDRITEIDAESKAEEERHNAAMIALDTERAELVHKLASEGLALIERKACPVEDVSDWRNWKAGDRVKCVNDNASVANLTVGKIYSVDKDDGGLGIVDDDGDLMNTAVQVDKCLEWNSRPTN